MANFNDKLSERSIQVIMLSIKCAQSRRIGLFGTCDILYGLTAETYGLAAQALSAAGLTKEAILAAIANIDGKAASNQPDFQSNNLAPDPWAKNTLERALREARALKSDLIETEHLLLGLLDDPRSEGVKLISLLGADPSDVRKKVIGLIATTSALQSKRPVKSPSADAVTRDTPYLDQYCEDLTALAIKGGLDPVIGREKEVHQLIMILCRRGKNNPVLIGEPGVGKTALLFLLAQKIASGDVPPPLQDKRVLNLQMGDLIANTKYRGDFEGRLVGILHELEGSPNIILAIDEVHNLVGGGNAEGALGASEIMKPALSRGLRCIGATTLDEYRKHMERDAALNRRFQPILVDPPSVQETIAILLGLRGRYETYHRVKITDSAISEAAILSDRYIADRSLPDKAIDLVDEACSERMIRHSQLSLENQLSRPATDGDTIDSDGLPVVDDDDIANVVAKVTGIPVAKLTKNEQEKLLNLENLLRQRVIGQERAVKAVANAIGRARTGLRQAGRPIACFVFAGPTGVGKTELAKALAASYFESEANLLRFDMSEYGERHTVSRLIGAPPGYVGYDDAGQLTEAVRRRPYSVLLFDEIEKAHPDIFNIFLQLMDDGRLTDARGRVVDFKNTIVIMTTNIGSSSIAGHVSSLGFGLVSGEREKAEEKQKFIAERVNRELQDFFRPEFLNRLDECIIFSQLTKHDLAIIVDLQMMILDRQLEVKGLKIVLAEGVREKVMAEGYSEAYGARPLSRAIDKLLRTPISQKILEGNFQSGQTIVAFLENDVICFAPEDQLNETRPD